jgi:hypothetical protein
VFQLGFVDLFCRDTQPADIRQVLSPNEGLVAYGASHGRSRVHRQEVGHQLARRRDAALDECRGQKPAADRFMKAVERATVNKSLHTPDLGGKATTKQVTDAVCETLRSAND